MWQSEKSIANLWRAFQIFPSVALLLFIGYAAFELFADRGNIENMRILAITPDPAHLGELVTVVYQGNLSDCEGIVHRYVVDANGTLIQLEDAQAFPSGASGDLTFTKTFVVPVSLAPGIATYHANAVRWCNGFQQLFLPVLNHYSVHFNVMKGK